MYVSALEMFSIGIGPSSSHTVGPMRAGARFVAELDMRGLRAGVDRFRVVLHGSLAATGIGHGTPDAVLAGLDGMDPTSCDPAAVHGRYASLAGGATLSVGGVDLAAEDVVFQPRVRDKGHPNAMTLVAEAGGDAVLERTYLSIGGGFVTEAPAGDTVGPSTPENRRARGAASPVSSYTTMAGLLDSLHGRSIADVARDDEVRWHGAATVEAGLDAVWEAISACVRDGLGNEGILPGGLNVPRRAARAHAALLASDEHPAEALVSVYAMAVNEQNAGGGRVVTAPTNGAAGVLPAVLFFLGQHGAAREQIHEFLLTASVIGSIIKANASISGAEGGCQTEVGSACAMAAAGLTAVRGGTPAQVENAAEIALEHHLGLTCDPVGGLVQIPCIERNAVAAATALTASRIALLGDGTHLVSLDTAVETMRATGADMSAKYKETSTGGLAVTVPYC
ncbi:L-serine ammonia-lyase [Arthrobacter ginkgonis]|uniref:L-serine dehydratase n=1 Tax=Arthrobacter ginkgonis TaxID=1630594 RepID=A0ABP7BUU0_9MICC